MVTVKGNHPLAEELAKDLFGITTVPKKEQERMVRRAIKNAVIFYETKIKEIHFDNSDGWISVKDRLPKKRELSEQNKVLICDATGQDTAFVENGKFYFLWNGRTRMFENELFPDFWRLLPNSPKGL